MNHPTGEPILQIRHLSTIFPDGNNGLHALDDISFSVDAEQFVCVLGPSGSGKTTLLRILAGLLPPTQGEIIFSNSTKQAPRHGVGMVFQKANLMPWRTVLDNILLPLEIQHVPRSVALAKAQALVDLVGLVGFESSLPRNLSGGMAQASQSPGHSSMNQTYCFSMSLSAPWMPLLCERMGTELVRSTCLKAPSTLRLRRSAPASSRAATRFTAIPRAATINTSAPSTSGGSISRRGTPFVDDQDAEQQQGDAVELGREDLRPLHPVRVAAGRRPLGEPEGRQRQAEGDGVGEHVAGVREQGEGGADDPRDHLREHEGDDQGEGAAEAARVGLGCDAVSVIVAHGSDYSSGNGHKKARDPGQGGRAR